MPGPPDAGPMPAFARPIDEAVLAVSVPVMTPLASRSVLRVHGADAQHFLHAQLTGDIAALNVHDTILTAWCTPKGRVIATVHVLRRAEDFVLVLATDLAESVLARLRLFVLRAKVGIDNLRDEVGVLGVSGEDALATPHARGGIDDGCIVIKACTPDDAQRRGLLVAPAEILAECWDQLSELGVIAVGETAWNRLLVRAGEPHVTAVTSDAFLPQMLNLDRIGGLSFSKGCYPGQEIIARTHYLGQLKRRMFVGHAATSALPQAGSTLHRPGDEQSVGQVLLSAHGDGEDRCELLATSRIDAAQQPLRLDSPDGPVLELKPPHYLVDGD